MRSSFSAVIRALITIELLVSGPVLAMPLSHPIATDRLAYLPHARRLPQTHQTAVPMMKRSPKDPDPDPESAHRSPVLGYEVSQASQRACGDVLVDTKLIAGHLWDNVGAPTRPHHIVDRLECGLGGHGYREAEWFIAKSVVHGRDAWIMGQKAVEEDYEIVCCMHTLGLVVDIDETGGDGSGDDGPGWAPCPAPGTRNNNTTTTTTTAAITTNSTTVVPEKKKKAAGWVSW